MEGFIMAEPTNDIWNKLMGIAFLLLIIGAILMFFGPKDDAGHVPKWWHFLMLANVALFFVGNAGARKYRANPADKENIEKCKEKLELSLSTGNEEAEAKAYFDLGIAYQSSYRPCRRGQTPDFGALDNAIKQLSRAHDIFQQLGNTDKQGLTLSNMAIIFYAKNQNEMAADYFRKALDIAKSLHFPAWERQTVNRFARLLGNMQHFAEAEKILPASILFARQHKNVDLNNPRKRSHSKCGKIY
jgi:tetratricopeptide (TPR) repeat protein